MDWTLALGALVVGIVVGLTGMGGGALMTPMLVLFFGVTPLAAVSSDLVASAVMKPVGSFVHIRNGTVRWDLVRWLALGSVPAAFCGVLIARALGHGQNVEDLIQRALGVALVVAATGLFVRAYLRLAERARHRDASRTADPAGPPRVAVRPVPTVIIGGIGGIVVGMTSVGSGSLIIIALMSLYPTLRASELVGTDLVQAVPLVASAAVGHFNLWGLPTRTHRCAAGGLYSGRFHRRTAVLAVARSTHPARTSLRPPGLSAQAARSQHGSHCDIPPRARKPRRPDLDAASHPTRVSSPAQARPERGTVRHSARLTKPGRLSRYPTTTPVL